MEMGKFEKNKVYDNVYLIFIDASGHSNIVRNNPRDTASKAFDLMYHSIYNRLCRVVENNRCEIGLIWSWLGDGGMIAIYDRQEKVSLSTTLELVQNILEIDLQHIQNEFKNDNINGNLHVRIAVHKGTIKYTDEGQQGFIHSSDINFGAHLEKATPRDSITISKDIYDIMPENKKCLFTFVGQFEERDIFVMSPNVNNNDIKLNWKSAHGFDNAENIQCYLERISQKDKAYLIDCANDTVIDFGTTLNTCSNYLFSTERPTPYRDAVCRLLARGGHFICYMLAPNSNGSRQLIELRKEDTDNKLNKSIERFKTFKKNNKQITDNFEVHQMDENPNLAAMIIDPDSENSICLYSPYLNGVPNENEEGLGRADMPHYLVNKNEHKMYDIICNYVLSYIKDSKKAL